MKILRVMPCAGFCSLSLFSQESQQGAAKTFPAYPIPDEIIETPVSNSALMYAGLHGASYQSEFIPGMLPFFDQLNFGLPCFADLAAFP